MELRTRKYGKGYRFLYFAKNLSNKREFIQDYMHRTIHTWLDAFRVASKIVVHRAAEATGKFVGNKIPEAIVKWKRVIDENSRNIEEIIILPEKRGKIISELRQVL